MRAVRTRLSTGMPFFNDNRNNLEYEDLRERCPVE